MTLGKFFYFWGYSFPSSDYVNNSRSCSVKEALGDRKMEGKQGVWSIGSTPQLPYTRSALSPTLPSVK